MKKYGIIIIALLLAGIAGIIFYNRSNKISNQIKTADRLAPSPVKNDKQLDPDDILEKNPLDSVDAKKITFKNQTVTSTRKSDSENELEYESSKMFEEEALEIFPLHTVQTHNPLEPDKFGPPKGEIWVRIKVDHSREFKDIMAQIADFYKEVTYFEDPVTVMLWVGGRPWAKFQYPPQDVENE